MKTQAVCLPIGQMGLKISKNVYVYMLEKWKTQLYKVIGQAATSEQQEIKLSKRWHCAMRRDSKSELSL